MKVKESVRVFVCLGVGMGRSCSVEKNTDVKGLRGSTYFVKLVFSRKGTQDEYNLAKC